MASPRRRPGPSVIDELLRTPYRFNFFQAVRLLERHARDQFIDGKPSSRPVGQDWPVDQETIRFRSFLSLSFPPAAIYELHPTGKSSPLPLEMIVTFMGLTGPNGVLPQHYTRLLLQRLRFKDFNLRDFLDVFNHRILSLFYRAWEKYRFFATYERTKLEAPNGEPDLFTGSLYSLVGLGTPGLRRRLSVHDEVVLFYGGLFARQPRTAISLERMLSEFLQASVKVEQFQGQWLSLTGENQTQLGNLENPLGLNTQLGSDAVAGERIWDVQSKLRLLVGPVHYWQFRDLLPGGKTLQALVELAKLYLGPDLEFDVQLILLPREVPESQLTREEEEGPRLGLNSWVSSYEFAQPASDAVFEGEIAL
jgi:type VI secretion system protein ImpH